MGKIGIYPIFPIKTLFFMYPEDAFVRERHRLLDTP